VLTVGGLAAGRVLGIQRLTEHVGVPRPLGGAVAIPLPHPSGASGWLNLPENRARLGEALDVVRRELHRLGTVTSTRVARAG
jgi:uracil-DNA glycosylase